MTVTQLECFLSIARTRNFGRAADQLGKTQPALSVQVRRLETDLGITLFERFGRQVRVTGAGEILVPHAERILAEVKESRTRMLEVKGGNLGVVRIGVLPTVAAYFLPDVLAAFKAAFPEVIIILREESRTALLLPLIRDNEIDLAFALDAEPSSDVRCHKLLTEDLSVAVGRKHPLARKTAVAISELEHEKFILYKSPVHSTRKLVMEYCHNAGFDPLVEFESEQSETIQNLVAANLGITILPDMIMERRLGTDLRKVRILPPAPSRTIVASWRTGRYLATTTRRFLQCAEKVGHDWNRDGKS
ncbi:MAG TPA: LysR family transcriptional regulator [Bryobacteraceae bacterium]|jgi:DNA-binding transcriptional LysR family regulator|nr:LysR family transcriptional regulator [Bryobacteraceae bacterium]